ncbi:MAG: methyltransferase [Polyangiaceae bacterium]|nr:methyltransferase [Polyangiaceae bacterium]
MTSRTHEIPLVSLAERVGDPGYTPKVRDLPKLLELMALDRDDCGKRDERVSNAERAVLRIEKQYLGRVIEGVLGAAKEAKRPLRGRLGRLVGRLAIIGTPEETMPARRWLMSAVTDADPKLRRAAMRALGNLTPVSTQEREAIERVLLSFWDQTNSDDDRRAMAYALGKIGSLEARAKLATVAAHDSSLGRTSRMATLMIDRTRDRETLGKIVLSRSFGRPIPVRFHTRGGLEAIVVEELGKAWRPHIGSPAGRGTVEAWLDAPLARATAIRTALYVGFPLPPVQPVPKAQNDGDLAELIVRAMTGEQAMAIFRTFTDTGGKKIRFRFAWAGGGHRRALTWRCAALVAKATTELVSDPTQSTWEVVVNDRGDRHDHDGHVAIELVPQGFDDPRFAYRKRDVPASSHRILAAALARLAPQGANDILWDPFVGAGTELVERAMLGPYSALVGTDIDARAVHIARANLASENVQNATIHQADCLTFTPQGVTGILTNPPMGRRVGRGTHSELLERFVSHAAHMLGTGGTLVWIVPEPERIRARAEQAGLPVEREFAIDMGGFPATLFVHRKRATACVVRAAGPTYKAL